MTGKPVEGQAYTIVGGPSSHRGLTGYASNVRPYGRGYMLWVGNVREWGALGIDATVELHSSEIEPAQPMHPAPAAPATKPSDHDGPEDELVGEITKALESEGYRVAVVGQRKAKGSGTTTGYPDMSVRHPSWPQGMACLIEVKVGRNGLTPEQAELYLAGWSHVARCIDDAFRAVEIAGGGVNP